MTELNRPVFDFSGKTVLVTGGTSGMGAATVEAFARSGARVVFAGRNEARAGSLLERIRQFSIEAHFLQVISLTPLIVSTWSMRPHR